MSKKRKPKYPRLVPCEKPRYKPTPLRKIKSILKTIPAHRLNLRVIDFFDPLLFGDGSLEPITKERAVKLFREAIGLEE
jgi:hypothetical protein